ncbi:MAG: glucose-6-phosphate 1-dehydrogenase [Patescibacteria group bacterium]|nr:glucose-6-phosphate 1-dehydrogenase [Patescibacteria group bacterium]
MNGVTTATPTIFIIFGITGDLAGRKLLPALLNLYVKKQLPSKFAIVGFSRKPFNREDFRVFVREHMNIRPGQYREEEVKHFIDHMYYEQGNFDASSSYAQLAQRLKNIDDGFHQCSNKLFHLSIPPSLYESIFQHLSNSGLTIPCGGDEGWTRILVEKPFGNDSEMAKKLDKKLGELFDENQVFRIDHYLAKEALQNILAFRFSNSLFEPLWNRKYVDKVHIKLLEKIGVEGRGAFYDGIGALKDVGQNHMLQMLALIAMEPPAATDAATIRSERAKVLNRLQPITSKNIASRVVRGQYEGYKFEGGVKEYTQTETYFRIESYINNPRWKNVPFYLESGKSLADTKTEIDIYFKNEKNEERQNVLTFRIQPDEGIKIRFWVKTPGFTMDVEPKLLKFKYSDSASLSVLPDAYEKVLHDAIIGDQTLFTSTEEVASAWKYVTSVLSSWNVVPLTIYRKGTQDVL